MAASRWAAVFLGGAPFALGVLGLRTACGDRASAASSAACEGYWDWPVTTLNVVYLPTFCVLFWLHALRCGSTWLIDPYWTLIPLHIHAYYASHPRAVDPRSGRALLAAALLYAWSARLSHNYWRREGWAPGKREDWRFADMRRDFGDRAWAVLSLPVAYFSQQGMLVGLTLPLQAVLLRDDAGPRPLGATDLAAAAVAVAGLEIARRADAALHAFAQTKRPGDVLDAGLWRISRHPNHLGEQLFWVGLAGLAVAAEGGWTPCAAGLLLNHVPDTLATLPLIDARMARNKHRIRNWLAYEAQVPMLYPTPSSLRRLFEAPAGAKAD